MGERGPRPIPSAILERRGSERARKNPDEPRPPRVAKPSAPRDMSPDAKKHWRKLVKLLDAMGVLTQADLVLVERYCELLAQWRAARAFINEKGSVYPVKKWNPHKDNGEERGEKRPPGGFEVVGFREFPQLKQLTKLDTALLQHEREMGLTPSSRTRLVVDGPREPGRPPGDAADRDTASTFKGPRLRSVGGGGAAG